MARANERGSVAGFVVVGVLLTALVVGGIYVVKNNLAGYFDGQTPEEATEQIAANTEDVANEAEESTPLDDAPSESNEAEQTPSDQEPAPSTPEPTPAPAPTPTPESQPTPEPTPQAQTPSQSDTASDSTPVNIPQTGVEVTHLPQTGPIDVLFGVAGLGALAAAVVAHRRSSQL